MTATTLEPMSAEELGRELADLPGWEAEGNQLAKTFTFRGFEEAVSFIIRVAMHAEQMQHHPKIVCEFNRVTLSLSTHDAGGITVKDFDMARFADQVADTVVSAGAG